MAQYLVMFGAIFIGVWREILWHLAHDLVTSGTIFCDIWHDTLWHLARYLMTCGAMSCNIHSIEAAVNIRITGVLCWPFAVKCALGNKFLIYYWCIDVPQSLFFSSTVTVTLFYVPYTLQLSVHSNMESLLVWLMLFKCMVTV